MAKQINKKKPLPT